ncbi:MAG: hypothetical protein ACOYXR_12445 [Nitrospirota bacterium]
MPDELTQLQGREVEVTYEGIVYRGRLVGADESELYLMTAGGAFNFPLTSITSVRPAA